ncbi:hypothetical protein SRHO_G00196370 [Serrasalmus rhombeus]
MGVPQVMRTAFGVWSVYKVGMLYDFILNSETMMRTLSVVLIIGFLAKVCGVAPLNNLAVGGLNAAPGSWPWQVNLQVRGAHVCSGSLINSNWVLTAAGCTSSYLASQITVYLGLQSLSTSNVNSVSRSVAQNIIYPETNYYNDIALLKLNSSVIFTDYIKPVCLATAGSTFFNGTQAWVTGWNTNTNAGTLMQSNISVVGNRECNCIFSLSINVKDTMMCSTSLQSQSCSNQMDIGGPLVIKQEGLWIQAGISIYHYCEDLKYTSMYTRVSLYQNWINQQIISNQPGFVPFISPGTDGDLSVSCPGLPPVATSYPVTSTSAAFSVVCGSAKLNSITGGGSSLATAGAWPWMASLQHNGIHVCGGTLVAEQFVLSSGDCFSSSTNASDWTVILGRLKQSSSNTYEVFISVTKISISSDLVNNVAVLQLSRKPTLSDYIQPICVDLGDNSFPVNTQCWASGWGSGGGAEQTLQQFNTTIVECGNASSSNKTICTGVMPLEQTSIGGTLMCKVDQSWVQPAVLTLVPKVPRASDVQVFIKISSVSEFLQGVVGTFPPKANTTSSNTTTIEPVSSSTSSLLFFMSLLLLSLPVFI